MSTAAPDYRRAETMANDPRIVRASLRAFFAVADRWRLKADEARRLLGAPSESTYYSWKKHGATALSPDVLMRISYVLGIAALLERLFQAAPARAPQWMRQPNAGPLTNGRTAIEFALEGGLVALDQLHGMLQSDAGGAPVSLEALTPARV
jgi:hypothetical protein